MYSIGDLARRTGVKVPTIRYYEDVGLLAPADRTEGNQRRYEPAALERLAFIRHGRDLGLSIEAIRDLIALSDHPESPCARADAIAAEHLAHVRQKIAQLKRLEGELARIVAACDAGHTAGDCSVLRALSDHGLCDGEHDGAALGNASLVRAAG
ncbi:MerR family transcriptional regulator [Rhizobium sp. YIM 134829]|uniref:MerR family transcriptional regulator n=1 Tax=Rhizobium sp. YIM 134829 TaxID=3390453 RepID=UPI00397ADA4F